MSNSIDVCKQNIFAFLGSGEGKRFLIPDYQRRYDWGKDEVTTFFDDIVDFVLNSKDKSDSTYFLGSVITFKNSRGEHEIIDGQQRLTTIYLLLRAIYADLEHQNYKSSEINNYISKIAPLIWEVKPNTTDIADPTAIMIRNEAVFDAEQKKFVEILATGKSDETATDNYSCNYRLLQGLYEKFCCDNKSDIIYDFIGKFLRRVILLPICAGDLDSALMIFSTLNNRGLQLSDADIFKARIYNQLEEADRAEFVEKWKDLQVRCERAKETVQKLFAYYMFCVRAEAGDICTTTSGVRKYFLNPERCANLLYDRELLVKLDKILRLCEFINIDQSPESEDWAKQTDICNAIDVLKYYPNEWWKYPVILYYLKHSAHERFFANFASFLKILGVKLLSRYLEKPALNSVKGPILKLNADIVNNMLPTFAWFDDIPEDTVRKKIIRPNGKEVRMMLAMMAYSKQTDRLPLTWEIEHILPVHHDPAYITGHTEEFVKDAIEHIGNKLPIEKRLNIVASNNFLATKRNEYKKSKIAMVKEFAESTSSNDWRCEEIIGRDNKFADSLLGLFSRYSDEYERLRQ